jgi:hypothetical protein
VIRSSIVHGNIDEAIQLIDAYFPGVLQEEGRGQELQLWLKCGKFVEMMREHCEHNKSKRADSHDRGSTKRSKSICNGSLANATIPAASPPPPSMSGRRPSYAAIAASLSPSTSTEYPLQTDMMDIDEHSKSEDKSNAWGRRASNTDFLDENGDNHGQMAARNEAAQSLNKVMEYGQRLQEEYRHDTRDKTRSSLVVSSFCVG